MMIKNTSLYLSIGLLLIFTVIPLELVSQNAEQYQRVRVFGDHEEFHELEDLGLDLCGAWVREGAYVEGDFSTEEMEIIDNSDLTYKVLYENASTYYKVISDKVDFYKASGADCFVEEAAKYPVPSNFGPGSLAGYFTYEEILTHVDNMANLYPALITEKTPIDTFLTHEDRPIYHTVITGPSDQEKEQILYTGIHHAREPMAVSQMIYFMWYLLENYDTDPAIQYLVDNYELHFVPCMNPDGYVYNEEEFFYSANGEPNFSFWRKNKRDNDGNGIFDSSTDGVDLNRNYGHEWAYDNTGSSDQPYSNTYRGPSAFSEPETQAIKYLCESNNFTVALNYHSYGDLLIYPWGYIGSFLTPDSSVFRNFAKALTLENNYLAGTGDETVGYLVNGDSDDWMYGEQTTKNKILSMTPEVGPSPYGFYPPASEIITLCQDNVFQNLSAARVTNTYGAFKELPSSVVGNDIITLDLEVSQYGLQPGAFTITATPMTDGINVVNDNFVTAELAQGESEIGTVEFAIDEDELALGSTLVFEVEIDNGLYVYSETIEKAWFASNDLFDAALVDSCQELNNWNNPTFDWGLTSLEYYSAPSALTESAGGDYLNQQQSNVVYKDTFNLETAEYAELSFWAKWDIEAGFDYVQLSAVVHPEMTEIPLCGNFTNINLDLGEPVYDGVQADWVQEYIDLTEFVGSKIQLKYEFYSDNFVTGDGFYLDDLSIRYVDSTLSVVDSMVTDTVIVIVDTMEVDTFAASIENLVNPILLSDPVPNPSDYKVQIEYQWPNENERPQLKVVNQLGQVVFEQQMEATNGNVTINVANWPSSIYFYYLETENNRSSIKRLVR